MAALLDYFQPHIWFDEDVFCERWEWPCSYLDDDDEVENNFEYAGVSPGSEVVYASAEVLQDCDGHDYWLLMYFYYYPANWNELACSWSLVGNGYTHEHDWEWIYVFVSYDYFLNPPDYVGYAAVLSGHNKDNIAAMGGECPEPHNPGS